MRDRHVRNDADGIAPPDRADRRSAEQSDDPIEKESEVSLENEKHIRKAYQGSKI
jgi:hypothetical protein